jgi:diguanylate cyclase (GGDEF)-like protein
LQTYDLSIFSLIILVFILFNAYKRTDKAFIANKIFITFVSYNIIFIIVDIFSWLFNGAQGQIFYILNTGFNLLLFIIEIFAGYLWVAYVDFQIFQNENRIRKMQIPLLIIFLINAVLSIASVFTGWFFTIDKFNIYHRGQLVFIHAILFYLFIIYSIILIILNRKLISKKYYYVLLFFPLPQIVGSILQIIFYGHSLNINGLALSLLLIYLYIQNRALSTDYLTGAYNRRQLDCYLKQKIRNSNPKKSFSAILIDIDYFKQINDNYGHNVGDEALQNTVNIITNCSDDEALIARYGGDEFYIILDIDDKKLLEVQAHKIKNCFAIFNKNMNKPYHLSVCIGYDVYDYKLKQNIDDFLKHIDLLMYEKKKERDNLLNRS